MQVKATGKVPVHAIKAYKGRRGIAPLIRNTGLEEGESIEIYVNKYRPTQESSLICDELHYHIPLLWFTKQLPLCYWIISYRNYHESGEILLSKLCCLTRSRHSHSFLSTVYRQYFLEWSLLGTEDTVIALVKWVNFTKGPIGLILWLWDAIIVANFALVRSIRKTVDRDECRKNSFHNTFTSAYSLLSKLSPLCFKVWCWIT